MTRETKIGLLVGLAFIIVIGILVSDHLSSSTEPPQAALATSGPNARRSVQVPGANRQTNPVGAAATAPRDAAPSQPIRTSAELTPRAPAPAPTAEVAIGPAQQANRPPVQITGSGSAPQTAVQQQQQQQLPARPQQPGNTQVAAGVPAGGAGSAVATAAQRPAVPGGASVPPAGAQPGQRLRPEADSDLVVVGPGNSNSGSTGVAVQTPDFATVVRDTARRQGEEVQPTRLAAATARPYKAQAGDTVSRMAARMLGANTKTNRDLIIRANPSLLADPNRVVVGQTYMIPEAPSANARAAAGTATGAQPGLDRLPAAGTPVTAGVLPLRQQPAPTSPAAAASSTRQPAASPAAAEVWYSVKERDTLWRIATTQCGGPSAVAAIKELNKATLKGGDTLRPNMKLRLPAKAG